MDAIKKLQTFITPETKFLALAEEASELAQAALKMARIGNPQHPTPKTPDEAAENLVEEISDVLLCLKVMGVKGKEEIMEEKAKRWCERMGL